MCIRDSTKEEDAFSKDLLLLMVKQYGLFLDSFQFACKNFKGNACQTDIAKTIGFESNEEYNEIMFLRAVSYTHLDVYKRQLKGLYCLWDCRFDMYRIYREKNY